jgi:hypothetical protein
MMRVLDKNAPRLAARWRAELMLGAMLSWCGRCDKRRGWRWATEPL